MPLSKKRMRERKRQDRVKPKSNLTVRPSVKPNVENLRQMIKTIEDKGKPRNAPQRPSAEASLPLYNPALHGLGDRVLVKPNYSKKLVETVIPTLDADGNSMPDYD